MTKGDHDKEHQLIANALNEDWLHHSMLLVHMATAHGFRLKDVTNAGSAMLLVWHDTHHGRRVFEDVENSLGPDFQSGLSFLRDQPTG